MLVSLGLAGWLVLREASPWARSMRDIRRIERDGAMYYRSSERSTRLYGYLNEAYFAHRRREPEFALERLRRGQAEASQNALFDYMEAAVQFELEDRGAAVAAIRQGNSKPGVKLYAGPEGMPDRWQWPQFDLARYAGKRVALDATSSREELVEVLTMGHKMLFSHPPDVVRLLQALEVRQAAAERLAALAENNGDPQQAAGYRSLIDEGQRFRWRIRRWLRPKRLDDDSRAVVIGRSIRSNNPRFRSAAMLLQLEEHASRAEELRDSHLRRDALEGLAQ